MATNRRQFGRIRKLASGRWQARYPDPEGLLRPAPDTFRTKREAEVFLSLMETDLRRGDWRDPDAGAVNFLEYAEAWIKERDLRPTTLELYARLLRLHIAPTFGKLDLAQITAPRVRAWRTALLEADKRITAAKAYRLLRSILATATDDDLIRRNPCRIRGAGKESSPSAGRRRSSRSMSWPNWWACAGGRWCCWPHSPRCGRRNWRSCGGRTST
ncbi:hypothetical protein [Streptacidiphilus sp. PB12-B1b]|uniref:phage integrase central domain-containing protein n=1 Tax=Streptacidiphilus sp. PB12-B1b TaxID=2705012 RepID=UPI00351A6208